MEFAPGPLLKALAHYQTLVSAAVGIAVAIAGYLRARNEIQQRYTFDVLMRYSHSPELLKALHRLRTHAATSNGKPSIDAALGEDLAITMPHFSAIALAANRGLLDRDIIVEARYAAMRSIWQSYGPYLTERSIALGRPLLYVDLQEFLRSNAGRYESYERSLAHRASSGIGAATPLSSGGTLA